MTSTHDEQALAAAYVLGALDAAERQAFESHLRTCTLCLSEVRSLQRVTQALSQSVPERTPRPEVRARVLSAVTGKSDRRERPVTKRSYASVWLPLAAAIILVAGLGLVRPRSTGSSVEPGDPTRRGRAPGDGGRAGDPGGSKGSRWCANGAGCSRGTRSHSSRSRGPPSIARRVGARVVEPQSGDGFHCLGPAGRTSGPRIPGVGSDRTGAGQRGTARSRSIRRRDRLLPDAAGYRCAGRGGGHARARRRCARADW